MCAMDHHPGTYRHNPYSVNHVKAQYDSSNKWTFTAMKQLFSYLKGHKKGRITSDPRPLDISKATFEDTADWKHIYGEIKEEMPPNLVEPKMNEVFITVYFYAAFANDMLTHRSTTGIIVFLNSTPVKWVCKWQNTINISTYGSELVVCWLAVEILIEYCIKMQKLGSKMVPASVLLGDNKSQITKCSLPSSGLKKKHNAIVYHRIREMVAAEIAHLGHVSSEEIMPIYVLKHWMVQNYMGYVKESYSRLLDLVVC